MLRLPRQCSVNAAMNRLAKVNAFLLPYGQIQPGHDDLFYIRHFAFAIQYLEHHSGGAVHFRWCKHMLGQPVEHLNGNQILAVGWMGYAVVFTTAIQQRCV